MTADLHVSVERLEDFRTLFGDIEALTRKEKLDAFYFLGDMWHEKHYVDSQVLNLIYNGLSSMCCKKVWVRGNHEVELKSDPHHRSYIGLFKDVCQIISQKEEIIEKVDGLFLWALPWFQPEDYKKRINQIRKGSEQKILLSHVAIHEGFVSASNSYRPETGVKLADMHPENFAMILLGDYHISQMLGENVMYLGAPIPLAHGDREHGIWMLDLGKGRQELTSCMLPSTYPQFIKHDFVSNNIDKIEYSAFNYNKFIVPQNCASRLEKLYGGGPKDTWEIVDTNEIEATPYRARATADELRTPEMAFEKWLKIKGLFGDASLKQLGLDYLDRHKIGK